MGSLRTLPAAALALWLCPAEVPAAGGSGAERARLFADCAGRYSALAEHRMLFDGPASEAALARRDSFVALLDAVLPDAAGVDAVLAMHWRVAAKAAQRRLLSTGRFDRRPAHSRPALERADGLIAGCDRLILGS
jgi:hypothetical protein